MDRRAYNRELLRDANSVLENILFPCSFPWNHPMEPVIKNIPRDIDEMYGIKAIIDDFSRDFRGKVEKLASVCQTGKTRAVSRRSEDPGVVEHTVIKHYVAPERTSNSISRKRTVREVYGDTSVPGELSLQLYRSSRIQAKLNSDNKNEKTMLSLRLGSTSSRRTIFQSSNDSQKAPLLLPALLPVEVQDGRKLLKDKAERLASQLGNYDCRHGLKAPPGNMDRRHVGRTRLMWTSKEIVGQKSVYRSILTGDRIENGSQRRPRRVLLGLRINGMLLGHRTPEDDIISQQMKGWLSNVGEIKDFPSYSNESVMKAIDDACKEPPSKPPKLHCTIDLDQYRENMMKHSAHIKRESLVLDGVRVDLPVINCVPSVDGIINVVCSMPGMIAETDEILDQSPIDVFLRRQVLEGEKCSVCWSDDIPLKLLHCVRCGVTAHASCAAFECTSRKWTCGACLSPLDLRSDCCPLCPYKRISGVQPKMGDYGSCQPVHPTCGIWCDAPKINRACALCGKNSTDQEVIVRCAAKGCGIAIHPMCGVIVTRISSEIQKQNQRAPIDKFLCTQYTLDMLRTSYHVRGQEETRHIPIVVCGYHNPMRRDLCGLPCEGTYLDGAMMVPPERRAKF